MKFLSCSMALLGYLLAHQCLAELHRTPVGGVLPQRSEPEHHFIGTKIVVFGDFGTGQESQALVAHSMLEYCRHKLCDFAVTVGDNIYPQGVENFLNNHIDFDHGKPDYNIITKIFIKNYRDLNIPVYLSFGNHDISDQGLIKNLFKDWFKSKDFFDKRTAALMMNQLNYTTHPDNPKLRDRLGPDKKLWNFPAPFYQVPESGDVALWAIDTNSYPHRTLNEHKLVDQKSDNSLQKTWLQQSLSASKAPWKIVFGHLPLFSHGDHGWLDPWIIKKFKASILDTLCEHRVDLYLSGHEHLLEIDHHQCPNGHLLTAIVSGAAAKHSHISRLSFPFFSPDLNLLWANGRPYYGHTSMYSDDEPVLGFTYLDISNPTQALITMKLAQGKSRERSDGCFRLNKGHSLMRVKCE